MSSGLSLIAAGDRRPVGSSELLSDFKIPNFTSRLVVPRTVELLLRFRFGLECKYLGCHS